MNSLGPSPTDIQSHLYASFLQASTFDVAIRVSGTWKAIYKLHRVVLIQSGFFRSLFTSGFSESSARYASQEATDEINIVFDDYNITRPAFEICIARLYGGGPVLHVSPNLLPSTNLPLTPPFSGKIEPEAVPAGQHPATPHFLLSLLATAIYLSIPSVASQALSLILKTVGPTTVLSYLNFSLGHPIEQGADDLKAAVGLENIASLIQDFDQASVTITQRTKSIEKGMSNLLAEKNDDLTSVTRSISITSSSSDGEAYELLNDRPSYHYGTISDKVGEACACWLARWATDMVHYEEILAADEPLNCAPRERSRSFSSVLESHNLKSDLPQLPLVEVPKIFRRGGLTAKWIEALVSADTLFVRSERERYNLAQKVVELRRREGIDQAEEKVWTTMFASGIYYATMTFEDILYISHDVSRTTGLPYVPLSTMQQAHWTQSILRHHITCKPTSPSSSPSSSPPPKDKELGITRTTADILLTDFNSANVPGANDVEHYYPVLGDTSLRVGDNGALAHASPTGTPISMDQLFSSTHSPNSGTAQPGGNTNRHSNGSVVSGSVTTNEETFFGLLTLRYDANRCVKSDPTAKARWSPFPPYRFAVEFWDIDLLREKSRLHSHTVWYAGSLFNVYVQIVRKKGQAQLGIYLHRQSHVDPIPAASFPFSNNPHQSIAPPILPESPPLERHLHLRQASVPTLRPVTSHSTINHYSPSIHPLIRNSTPSINGRAASPPSPSSPHSNTNPTFGPIPTTSIPQSPSQPYRDPRSAVSAYFAISCASATGSSQTRFSSTPDIFSVSQSWGWKSSTLRTEEFVELGSQPSLVNGPRGKEVSLRATIVLGVV